MFCVGERERDGDKVIIKRIINYYYYTYTARNGGGRHKIIIIIIIFAEQATRVSERESVIRVIINKTFISAIDEKSFCYLALGTGVTHYIQIDRIGVKLVILFLIGY